MGADLPPAYTDSGPEFRAERFLSGVCALAHTARRANGGVLFVALSPIAAAPRIVRLNDEPYPKERNSS
jgi:hypothetical protein